MLRSLTLTLIVDGSLNQTLHTEIITKANYVAVLAIIRKLGKREIFILF